MYSSEHEARLAELGFVWHVHHAAWESMFIQLKRYKEQFGHCNVPVGWNEHPGLGPWMENQRRFNKTGKLSSVRKGRLDELGFDWSRKS